MTKNRTGVIIFNEFGNSVPFVSNTLFAREYSWLKAAGYMDELTRVGGDLGRLFPYVRIPPVESGVDHKKMQQLFCLLSEEKTGRKAIKASIDATGLVLNGRKVNIKVYDLFKKNEQGEMEITLKNWKRVLAGYRNAKGQIILNWDLCMFSFMGRKETERFCNTILRELRKSGVFVVFHGYTSNQFALVSVVGITGHGFWSRSESKAISDHYCLTTRGPY